MGVLGRGEGDGPAARLPPLPRGSGVAQRLRGIRCACPSTVHAAERCTIEDDV